VIIIGRLSNEYFASLESWCSVNLSKTEMILFRKYKPEKLSPITFYGKEVNFSGLYFLKSKRFTEHLHVAKYSLFNLPIIITTPSSAKP